MICVVARSNEHGRAFVNNHHFLSEKIEVKLDVKSYFNLINELIEACPKTYICLVHDDVQLPASFTNKIEDLVQNLRNDGIDWGVIGNAGVTSFGFGLERRNIVRYIGDPHGGPNNSVDIFPAQSIDGNVMLINLARLKEKKVKLPPWEGFQLYDLTLSIECISAGLAVLAAPHLACWHNSKGNQTHFDLAKSSDVFHDYIRSKLKNRYFESLNGSMDIGLGNQHPLLQGRIDLSRDSIKVATKKNNPRTVTIVTRTQFQRIGMLKRLCNTIQSFIANGDVNKVIFNHVLVTDQENVHSYDNEFDLDVIFYPCSKPHDTRFELVKFAADQLNTDFLWFVDDDDWVFNNESSYLSDLISSTSLNSLYVVGTQHFHESISTEEGSSTMPVGKLTPGRYFSANDFSASLIGTNHTPFCGLIYPREVVKSLPDNLVDNVTYFEDFALFLYSILSGKCQPIIHDKLLVGVSVRESGNTITEMDRTKWDRSMSELISSLVNQHHRAEALLGLRISGNSSESYGALYLEIDALKNEVISMKNSRSWKITKGLRGLGRLLRREINLAEFFKLIKQNVFY